MADVGMEPGRPPDRRAFVVPAVNAPGSPVDRDPHARQQRSLQDDLRRVISASPDLNSAAQRLAEVARSLVGAPFLSFIEADAGGLPRNVASVGSIDNIPDLPHESIAKLCRLAIKNRTLATHTLGQQNGRHLVAIPIRVGQESSVAVVALLEEDDAPLTKRLLILELVSYALEHWDVQRKAERYDWEARTATAVAELVSQIETSPSQSYACLLAANRLNEYLTTTRCAIALKDARPVGVTLRAISGKAEFDHQAELSKQLVAAMDETLIRDCLTAWPPRSSGERHAVLAHRMLAEQQHDEAVVSIPLKTVRGTTIGVWLCCGPRSVLHASHHLHGITTIAPYVATALDIRKAADPGPVRAVTQKFFGTDAAKSWWCLTAALLLCLVPLIPIKHRIKAACVVEPVQHRYTVVPFDGVLEETYVRPGDEVTAGQLIARMDDRELGWELAGLLAEAGRAAKKSDVAMAAHDVHEAQMAALEKERLEQRIQILRHRQKNLEISSSIDGVVLKGDLEEAHGAPVKIGQSLFEIAPLSPLKLELAVPEDAISYVQAGMPVTARLDGYPQGKIHGHVDKLRSRAEIRDNQNVFVAEVTLENNDRQLRPGMSGRARLVAQRRLLGWIWLHQAWHRVRNAMGV